MRTAVCARIVHAINGRGAFGSRLLEEAFDRVPYDAVPLEGDVSQAVAVYLEDERARDGDMSEAEVFATGRTAATGCVATNSYACR